MPAIRYLLKTIFFIVGLVFSFKAFAHIIVDELATMSKSEAATAYLIAGFEHILPMGLDHILFIVGLFLFNPKLKSILIQSTVFTVAHSVTLILSSYDIIAPPETIVEPLIALSIAYIAIENIFLQDLKPTRIVVVFLFGLLHGMGFAGALSEVGLPENAYLLSLISFNIGVELGQVTVILLAYLLIAKWFSRKPWYRSRIVIPISIVIAIIALYWSIDRMIL